MIEPYNRDLQEKYGGFVSVWTGHDESGQMESPDSEGIANILQLPEMEGLSGLSPTGPGERLFSSSFSSGHQSLDDSQAIVEDVPLSPDGYKGDNRNPSLAVDEIVEDLVAAYLTDEEDAIERKYESDLSALAGGDASIAAGDGSGAAVAHGTGSGSDKSGFVYKGESEGWTDGKLLLELPELRQSTASLQTPFLDLNRPPPSARSEQPTERATAREATGGRGAGRAGSGIPRWSKPALAVKAPKHLGTPRSHVGVKPDSSPEGVNTSARLGRSQGEGEKEGTGRGRGRGSRGAELSSIYGSTAPQRGSRRRSQLR